MGHGSHVKLKKEDYENFCKEYGQKNIDSLIEEMNDWIDSGSGKEYRDYKAGLKTWIRRRNWKKGQESVVSGENPHPIQEPTEEQKQWEVKKKAQQENYQWVEKLVYERENREYFNNLRFRLYGHYCEVPEIPESKVYYDSPGFKPRINCLLQKLKTKDYAQKGILAC